MTEDPIVAEVREARAKLMAECDFDLDKLFGRIKQLERRHRGRLVTKEQLDARRERARSAEQTPPTEPAT